MTESAEPAYGGLEQAARDAVEELWVDGKSNPVVAARLDAYRQAVAARVRREVLAEQPCWNAERLNTFLCIEVDHPAPGEWCPPCSARAEGPAEEGR